MKALQFSATGDLASLRFVDVATPVPAAGEVLVQIKAAGLNPSDVKNVLGRFPYTTLPRIPGRDFAGVVVEGPQALLGQEVWGTGRDLGFFADGSHAEFVKVSAKGVAHKPSHLSFAQAASLGVPYTTAWDALERSGVGKGTRLLVIGANGAVGSAALALAKIRGAQVLAAVRRASRARVRSPLRITAYCSWTSCQNLVEVRSKRCASRLKTDSSRWHARTAAPNFQHAAFWWPP